MSTSDQLIIFDNVSKFYGEILGVNRVNLVNFRKYLPRRTPGSLESLLLDDKRFKDANVSADAYAEAWALNYYFLHRHSEAYVKYLAALAELKPLVDTDPALRIKQFKQFFGDDLQTVENDFLRYMRTVN